MKRALMINADDFGMCHAANEATMALLECGGVTSATVMTPCAWAPEAMAYAAKHIAKYAMPKEIEFRDELPKTLVGKVAYRVLEEEEAERQAHEGN